MPSSRRERIGARAIGLRCGGKLAVSEARVGAVSHGTRVLDWQRDGRTNGPGAEADVDGSSFDLGNLALWNVGIHAIVSPTWLCLMARVMCKCRVCLYPSRAVNACTDWIAAKNNLNVRVDLGVRNARLNKDHRVSRFNLLEVRRLG